MFTFLKITGNPHFEGSVFHRCILFGFITESHVCHLFFYHCYNKAYLFIHCSCFYEDINKLRKCMDNSLCHRAAVFQRLRVVPYLFLIPAKWYRPTVFIFSSKLTLLNLTERYFNHQLRLV